MRFFDDNYEVVNSGCNCCFSCIKRHEWEGCDDCSHVISEFFPSVVSTKIKKSVGNKLKNGLTDLFDALNTTSIMVESALEVDVSSFIKDFIYMADEIKSETDIIELWSIDLSLASEVYSIFKEIVGCDVEDGCTNIVVDSESEDEFDYDLSDSSSNCD